MFSGVLFLFTFDRCRLLDCQHSTGVIRSAFFFSLGPAWVTVNNAVDVVVAYAKHAYSAGYYF